MLEKLNMNKLLKKCPNCGAAIEHNYNHKCPYCRTYLHMTDNETRRINNCDIRIDDVEIQKNPLRMEYLLIARGWSVPKFQYLEEIHDDYFITSGSDVGKRIGFVIVIPDEILRKRDFMEIEQYVVSSIPRGICDKYNKNIIFREVYNFFSSHQWR